MIIEKQTKFKTTYLSVKFKEELTIENIGFRALLPSLIKTKSKTHPNRKALQEALNDLYGAKLSVKTSKIGLVSIIDFSISFINPDFSSEPLFFEAVKLLHEVIYQPNLPKADFEIEKRMLVEKIKAFENDKTSYAVQRLFEEMFKEERYGLSVQGKVDDVLKITYQDLNKYYKQMLKTNSIDVVISGQVSEQETELLKEYFKEGKTNLTVIDRENKEIKEFKEITEYDTISQSKVNLGYRLPIRIDDPLQQAATLFNVALGGGIHSRLFLNVREKHSLCYYISSSYDALKGFLFIYSGIDKERVSLALKVVDEQILDLQTNKLSEEELFLSKQTLINRLKEAEDAQVQSVEAKYSRALVNNTKSLEERIELIMKVTPEEVLEAAKLLQKDTLYILAPEVK